MRAGYGATMPIDPSTLKPFDPIVDRFDGVEIWRASVSPMDNIAYVIADRATGQALLVDAAEAPMRLGELIAIANDAVDEENDSLPLEIRERPHIHIVGIVTTHQHADHWQALEKMRRRLAVPSYAGELDAAGIGATVDRPLADGATLGIGHTTIEVALLRGHTPGSIALVVDVKGESTRIITGDSLFPGGPGKTNSKNDFERLMDDLETKIFDRFADSTVLYPGHGAPTTIGAERPHLAEWRERGW